VIASEQLAIDWRRDTYDIRGSSLGIVAHIIDECDTPLSDSKSNRERSARAVVIHSMLNDNI
jgi:hypothetical protein